MLRPERPICPVSLHRDVLSGVVGPGRCACQPVYGAGDVSMHVHMMLQILLPDCKPDSLLPRSSASAGGSSNTATAAASAATAVDAASVPKSSSSGSSVPPPPGAGAMVVQQAGSLCGSTCCISSGGGEAVPSVAAAGHFQSCHARCECFACGVAR